MKNRIVSICVAMCVLTLVSICAVSAARYDSPFKIPYSDATIVDGSLDDWAGSQWMAINAIYDGTPSDIAEAYYTMRWGNGGTKLYMAVKVRDTSQVFTDSYTNWNAKDGVELYIHTTNPDLSSYAAKQEAAQQYAIGIKNSNHNEVWTAIGYEPVNHYVITPADGFEAAGRVSGEWLYYEASMTAYKYFGGMTNAESIISPLFAGQTINADVVVTGRSTAGYTGMKCEHTGSGMSEWWANTAYHELIRPGVQGKVELLDWK